MNRQLHDKFQSAAAYEGRSMSGQILYLVNPFDPACCAMQGAFNLFTFFTEKELLWQKN